MKFIYITKEDVEKCMRVRSKVSITDSSPFSVALRRETKYRYSDVRGSRRLEKYIDRFEKTGEFPEGKYGYYDSP
jgi:hypothetical protein